jgi:alkylation response protein AidB-like acyl-CoA dehydrogenase
MTGISPDELRERTRALLEKVHPDDPQVDRVTFRGAQFDHGLAFVHFPEGLGGLGLEPRHQQIVDDELRQRSRTHYRNSTVNLIGIGMAAPTLLTYAPEEIQRRFLRPIFTGEEIWCQLFSEPGAGSDVAALGTRAVRDGDDWVVRGQKVWTTLAHVSRFGMLLARTDPERPKHDGLSYFILDMQAPGVEVRPLYQITGEAEFNEVFLTDVRIPHEWMLGKEGQGWRVALTTLMNERVAIGGSEGVGRKRPLDYLLDVWKRRAEAGSLDRTARDAILRDRVTELWIESRLHEITSNRARSARRCGNPGPEGSVGKLTATRLNQRIYEACLQVLGPDALEYAPGYELRRPEGISRDPVDAALHWYLRSRAATIEGGTSQIMRNILGERILGLPGEPRVDKGRAWSELRRGA